MAPPINPLIQTPYHQTKQSPIDGEVFTDFKSSKRIEISPLIRLIQFLLISGVPRQGWGWVDGGGWGCMHMCIFIIGNSQGFPKWGCHLQLKLSCLTCIYACVCMHMHVHICGGIPYPYPYTNIHPSPTSQSHREPKSAKFNKS